MMRAYGKRGVALIDQRGHEAKGPPEKGIDGETISEQPPKGKTLP